MAVLKQLFGNSPLPVYPLSEDTITIGRHQDCDIVVESPAVSRQHARILKIDSRYYVEDLGSRNGSHLNGQTISDRTVLRDGDQIEVSNLPFTFFVGNPGSDLSGSGMTGEPVMQIPAGSSASGDSIRRQTVQRGERLTSTELSTQRLREEQVICRMLVSDGSGAWPVANNATTKLNHALRLLHSLRRYSDSRSALATLQSTLFELFPAAQRLAIVLELSTEQGVEVIAADSRDAGEQVEICLPVVQAAMQESEAILYADHWRERDSGRIDLANSTLPTILVAPLIDRDGCPNGAVQLDTTDTNCPLEAGDLELLLILGQLISFGMDQLAILKRSAADAALQRSTADARMLHSYLFVDDAPSVPGLRLGHQLVKTSDVAADHIDYLRMPDGRLACLVIDVPGRGSDAAALLAVVTRSLTGGLLATQTAAGTLQNAADDFRERITATSMITSVAVLLLDPQRGSVSLSVAGHCPVCLVRNGASVPVTAARFTGPPLGLSDRPYPEAEILLDANDTLFVFTDGITRLAAPDGAILQMDQLHRYTEDAASGRTATDQRLRQLLDEFRQSAAPTDDVGFVTVARDSLTDTQDDGTSSAQEADKHTS